MHACEETIRKRVNEFKFTNTAMLTRGQLKEIEAKETDPYEFKYDEQHFNEKVELP